MKTLEEAELERSETLAKARQKAEAWGYWCHMCLWGDLGGIPPMVVCGGPERLYRCPPQWETPEPSPPEADENTGLAVQRAYIHLPQVYRTTLRAEFPERRGELHAVCAANNVRAAAMHPQLVEWAKANVTVEQLREAIAQARIHKPPPESLNPAYLAPIVDRLRLGKRPDPNSAWAVDDEAAIAKGRELGVTAKRGEDFNAYRQRLREALQQVGRSQVA